jgi:hypothetical protein
MINAVDTLITVAIATQAWSLKEIVGLKSTVAALPCHPDSSKPCAFNEKRNKMKKYAGILSILILTALVLVFAGCTTANPSAPVAGQTFQPVVADTTTISNLTAKVQAGIAATAPVNPYAGLLELIASGVAAAVTGVSIVVARIKSNQASKASAAVATIAAGVVKAGPTATTAVLDHASTTPEFATVANHINDATP